MTFDLSVWPVDRAMSHEEAIADLEARKEHGFRLGLGHDRRLDPFIAEMERRYRGIRDPGPAGPAIEFDVHRDWVFLGIGWDLAERVAADVAEIAHRTGLAVFDHQREVVGLPAPYAAEPLSQDGIERHLATAERAFGAVMAGASSGGSDVEVVGGINERLRSLGGTLMSPLGFEVTPDLEAEVLADPARIPSSLQTPATKAELIAALSSGNAPAIHRAMGWLAGWDPDPQVASALRTRLDSDDVYEATMAAAGLARQGDLTDLPALVELVHRLSPADGGTPSAMYGPLKAALELADQAGPPIVEGLKSRARTWRGEKRRRASWDQDFDAELDALLAPAE